MKQAFFKCFLADPRLILGSVLVLMLCVAYLIAYFLFWDHPPVRVLVQATRNLQVDAPLMAEDMKVVVGRYAGNEIHVSNITQATGLRPQQMLSVGSTLLQKDLYRPTSSKNAPDGSSKVDSALHLLCGGSASFGQCVCAGRKEGRQPRRSENPGQQPIADQVLPCAELDATVQQAMAPVMTRLDSIYRQLKPDKGSNDPDDDMEDSFDVFKELLHERQSSGSAATGSTTFFDLIGSGFDIGEGLLGAGIESKEVFLDQFLGDFLKEFGKGAGGELGTGLGKAVNELGSLVYERLTAEDKLTRHLRSVQFNTIGSFEGTDLEQQLDDIVSAAKPKLLDGNCSIMVSGHTDTLGTDKNNRDLSRRRAKKVAERLQIDFPGMPITTVGWGERRLNLMTDDGVASIDNRRVEIELICR